MYFPDKDQRTGGFKVIQFYRKSKVMNGLDYGQESNGQVRPICYLWSEVYNAA